MENLKTEPENSKEKKSFSLSTEIVQQVEIYAEGSRRSVSNAAEYLLLKGLESEKTIPQTALQN